MTNNPFDISGRVALVTGGRRGLGLAMSEGLASAGAKLACIDISDEYDELRKRVEARGAELAYFQADLTDQSQRNGLADRVVERFGRLDILVNCAGIQHRQPAMEFDLTRWDTILSLMLGAPGWTTIKYRVTSTATQAVDKPQSPRLVNVDQILAKAASEEQIPQAAEQITELLRERHHIRPGQDNDFNIRDMTALTKTMVSRWW